VNKRDLSRRGFVTACAAGPLLLKAKGNIPVGLELYSVREELKKDLPDTLKAVAADGYQCAEFFASYHDWTIAYARGVRKQLDQLKLRCYSTHNALGYLGPDQIQKTIELNQALGARFVVVASAGDPKTIDGWRKVADKLTDASKKLAGHKLQVGYHNHETEFTQLDGTRPMEVLAQNTPHNVTLQLDVGTCVKAGSDPVAWIKQNPGRIRSMHCKDWSPQNDYKVLLGEGVAPWKKIFEAAEAVGGIEYYLVEQEGSRYSELETAKRCFTAFQKLHHGV
jgi:sugar phosphate isomerase/epimerase